MHKNRVVLLNLPLTMDSTYANIGSVYPSTAIMLLGTLLKKNGYDVHIIDGAYHPDYLETLSNQVNGDEVLYVGMSVMTTQIPFALKASKTVKEFNKNLPVIWGGPHPTLFPELTLSNENIDIIAINEGAFTALRLAECLQKNMNLNTINGIGYKDKNNNIVIAPRCELDDINELPRFDFSLIDIDNYLNPKSQSVYQREFPDFRDKVRIMPILTGLGCPYRCEFCINPILKRRYRFRPAESIVEEIKYLKGHYDVNTFLFLDEDFFINKRRALEFVSLVEKEGLHFNWRMWARVDHFKDDYVNRELVRRLESIGYGSMAMGAESASQEILDCLKKAITTEQTMNSLNVLTGTGIFPRYSFMVGLENESMEQIANTYKFCLNMTKINPKVDIAGPFIFRLYPGSAIYNRLVAKYDLGIPDSLDSWTEYLKKESSFVKMPWTPKLFPKNLRLLTFYSHYAFISHPPKSRYPRQILFLLYRKLSRLRLKYFFLKLPLDYWLYLLLNRIYHLAKVRT